MKEKAKEKNYRVWFGKIQRRDGNGN